MVKALLFWCSVVCCLKVRNRDQTTLHGAKQGAFPLRSAESCISEIRLQIRVELSNSSTHHCSPSNNCLFSHLFKFQKLLWLVSYSVRFTLFYFKYICKKNSSMFYIVIFEAEELQEDNPSTTNHQSFLKSYISTGCAAPNLHKLCLNNNFIKAPQYFWNLPSTPEALPKFWNL